ncbi:hypothetical protein VCHC17A1_2594A, partial [Vibrio cholerae HC-17A1]
MNIMTLFEVFL